MRLHSYAVAVAIVVARRRRRFAKNKQKIQYQTSCIQYLHLANISDGDKDTLIIQVPSVVISLFVFTLSCPVTFTVSKHSFLFKLMYIKAQNKHILIVFTSYIIQSIFL